jgi:hypothetical protein
MNIVWNYLAIGLLTLVAAAAIAGGEPAVAELRLAEAATTGVNFICSLAGSEPASSNPE